MHCLKRKRRRIRKKKKRTKRMRNQKEKEDEEGEEKDEETTKLFEENLCIVYKEEEEDWEGIPTWKTNALSNLSERPFCAFIMLCSQKLIFLPNLSMRRT